MNEPVVLQPVMQQDIADCGVACLVMMTGLSYAQVLAAFSKRAKVSSNGMSRRQLMRAAKKLGFPLRFVKNGDLSNMVGIADLQRYANPDNPAEGYEEHLVIVAKGVLYNPAEGLLWTDIDSYFKTRRWVPLGMYVRTEDKTE